MSRSVGRSEPLTSSHLRWKPDSEVRISLQYSESHVCANRLSSCLASCDAVQQKESPFLQPLGEEVTRAVSICMRFETNADFATSIMSRLKVIQNPIGEAHFIKP